MNLIDKNAALAEIDKKIAEYYSDSENTMGIYPYALKEAKSIINSLEVKNIDLVLEKEYKRGYDDGVEYCSRHT